ncbi:MAG: DNA polymerase III subunit delta [Rhodospirillales bacterium]
MRIPPARVEAFLKAPDAGIRAVLVYGPDAGLVRERADRLARGVAPDDGDPFRISELIAADLAADPPRLNDEAAALCLTGGRRVVRVRDADDRLGEVFRQFLADPPGDALVVVEAAELGPRSKLRAAFEAAKSGAALPCYVEDLENLAKVVRAALAGRGLKAGDDAAHALAALLGPDRMLLRGEVEKLALYVGEAGAVTADDVLACGAEAAAVSLDEAVDACLAGNQAATDRALGRLAAEGVAPVRVLRALASHLAKLAAVHARDAAREDAESAMAAQRIFFKRQSAFRAQLRVWRGARLARALARAVEAELRCKETGQPDRLLCERTFMDLAAGARAMGAAA